MPAKRKPLESITGSSMASTSDGLPSTPVPTVKKRRGRPPKGAAPAASHSLFPGESIAQLNILERVSTCKIYIRKN